MDGKIQKKIICENERSLLLEVKNSQIYKIYRKIFTIT